MVNNLASANQTIAQATNLQAIVNSQTVAQGELVDSIVTIRSEGSGWIGVADAVVLENSAAGTAVADLRFVTSNQTTEYRNGVPWTITPWWEHESHYANVYVGTTGQTVSNRVGSIDLNADGSLTIQGPIPTSVQRSKQFSIREASPRSTRGATAITPPNAPMEVSWSLATTRIPPVMPVFWHC